MRASETYNTIVKAKSYKMRRTACFNASLLIITILYERYTHNDPVISINEIYDLTSCPKEDVEESLLKLQKSGLVLTDGRNIKLSQRGIQLIKSLLSVLTGESLP